MSNTAKIRNIMCPWRVHESNVTTKLNRDVALLPSPGSNHSLVFDLELRYYVQQPRISKK